MMTTSVCVAELEVTGVVWTAVLITAVETVWVATVDVGVGVMRRSISFWSCWLDVLASSNERVSWVTREVAVKEALFANWSFDLSDAISSLRDPTCLRAASALLVSHVM